MMINLIKKNRLFFWGFAVLTALGGILVGYFSKPEPILFFSKNRTALLDSLFSLATHLGEEPIYFIAVIALLFSRVRHAMLVGMAGLTVMGLSFALKALFAVDRPWTFLKKNDLADSVQLVAGTDLNVGPTSFPSGHAMAAFALYSLLIFLLPNKKRIAVALLCVAILVAVSRVYLVQHFLEDVYAGAIIGVLIAVFFYWLELRYPSKFDGPIHRRRQV